MRSLAALVGLAAMCSAQAQEHLLVSVDEIAVGSWQITAELLNPDPSEPLLVVIADVGFDMRGAGFQPFGFDYNPGFGPNGGLEGPTIILTPNSVYFLGSQGLPPLFSRDDLDSSNPMIMAEFSAQRVDSFELIGQVSGAYDDAPFPVVFSYQLADGSPGSVPYSIEINPIPTPGSVALLAGAGLAGIRRRRR